jgi:hypothetical protein
VRRSAATNLLAQSDTATSFDHWATDCRNRHNASREKDDTNLSAVVGCSSANHGWVWRPPRPESDVRRGVSTSLAIAHGHGA